MSLRTDGLWKECSVKNDAKFSVRGCAQRRTPVFNVEDSATPGLSLTQQRARRKHRNGATFDRPQPAVVCHNYSEDAYEEPHVSRINHERDN